MSQIVEHSAARRACRICGKFISPNRRRCNSCVQKARQSAEARMSLVIAVAMHKERERQVRDRERERIRAKRSDPVYWQAELAANRARKAAKRAERRAARLARERLTTESAADGPS